MRASQGLEYRVNEYGVAVLCGIGCCTDEHIIVASDFEGYAVKEIAEKAFCRVDRIKSVSIPSSVTIIGDQAFSWCRSLVRINATDVEKIGDRAFMGCEKLTSFSFGFKLEEIGEKAFAYCSSILAAALPDSVCSIGKSAFEGCRNIGKIYVSDNVSVIESGTFYSCDKLRKVILPSDLEYIDEYAFAYCISLLDMDIPHKTVINKDAFFECGNLSRDGKVS